MTISIILFLIAFFFLRHTYLLNILVTILVGNIPIELSQLLHYFLTTGEERNNLMTEVTGKRKREIGLVAPVKYTAITDDKLFA